MLPVSSENDVSCTSLGLLPPSVVVERGGRKIGIIGYVTVDTAVSKQHTYEGHAVNA